ncbi:IS701 family transposase [Nonomuraea sp. NPDC059007]|uniref:IS701 family transposase n=1 Tax=Nonomuraea sp. NPDC059007 TaxID=3346692 RepID=UPI0036A1C8B8
MSWDAELAAMTSRIADRLFKRPEPKATFGDLVRGLLADVPRKNSWQLADHLGHPTANPIEWLLSRASWDAAVLRDEVRAYVVKHLGSPDGVLIADDTQAIKKGDKSVGVARQYCGLTGQVENCQVMPMLTYASAAGHAFINRRLYLPEDWAGDAERRRVAGVPEQMAFATKPQQVIDMLAEERRADTPFRYLAADSGYGRDPGLRAFCHTNTIAYWDHYATGVAADNNSPPELALKNAFGWTQYDGHGPGDELLGDPATALELGCGRGHAVAALATKGVEATGIDLSPVQVEGARALWGHLPNAHYAEADVIEFLDDANQQWAAIYSIFGALWFTDPAHLLPRIHRRLAPGGRLVFSQAPAVPGSYGVQGMYGAGFCGPQTWVYRWAYEPETWARMLAAHGFVDVRAWHEPAPDLDHVGTLLVQAHRPMCGPAGNA